MVVSRKRRQAVSRPSWILEGEENGMRDMSLRYYDEYSAYVALTEIQSQLNDDGWQRMKDNGEEATYCLNGVTRVVRVIEVKE